MIDVEAVARTAFAIGENHPQAPQVNITKAQRLGVGGRVRLLRRRRRAVVRRRCRRRELPIAAALSIGFQQ